MDSYFSVQKQSNDQYAVIYTGPVKDKKTKEERVTTVVLTKAPFLSINQAVISGTELAGRKSVQFLISPEDKITLKAQSALNITKKDEHPPSTDQIDLSKVETPTTTTKHTPTPPPPEDRDRDVWDFCDDIK